MNTTKNTGKPEEETNVVETLQSLIVAFSLAMAVRSFVTEGFVIPTGSMAPTLMGAHVRLSSPVTGYSFPIDGGIIEGLGRDESVKVIDPMVSIDREVAMTTIGGLAGERSMGDRVLVLKYLYAFRIRSAGMSWSSRTRRIRRAIPPTTSSVWSACPTSSC